MRKTTFISVLIVMLIVPVFARTTQTNPSLSETVGWLTGVIEEKVVDIYATAPRSLPTIPGVAEWTISKSDGCQLTLKNPVPANKQTKLPLTQRPYQVSITFSFADVNPDSIVVEKVQTRFLDSSGRDIEPVGGVAPVRPASYWAIDLRATDNAKVIRWQIDANKFESTNLRIVVNEQDMAQRILKATKHATTLCGGKPDKKEPF